MDHGHFSSVFFLINLRFRIVLIQTKIGNIFDVVKKRNSFF